MEFQAEKKFIITLTEDEARTIEGELTTFIRVHGNSGAIRNLREYLRTRNEIRPHGEEREKTYGRQSSDW